MPRVLRTSIRPFQGVMHACRDVRGNRVMRESLCNTFCENCNTQIVYVFDNTPPQPRR